MSCEIHVIGNISDVPAIRRCLFPTDDLRGSDSWLQQCDLSVSPIGDVIAIAKDRRLVILSAKWDSESSISQFQISFSGAVHESDNVKAVLCLPVVNQTKSSHVSLDWTCIMLGFESGYVRFYTENFELLLEEQLHCEVISNIKCSSQHNPRPDISPELHPEEIYVQYQSNVCVIDGKQLFPILRNCRLELAKVQAKGDNLELPQNVISPKKWGFQEQASINDFAVVGVNLHGDFDHLLTVSICGGFDSKYRSSAPYNNLVLAAGSRPFVGYHYALEGCPQNLFSDVAKVVTTKLKSALPSWLTGNKSSIETRPTVAMQAIDNMGCRFGLCDLRRIATSIVLSPDHKLAAVSDALGRVILMDAFRGIALKIFKGYRDAQCSFIQVPDERHSKFRLGDKVALFLIIYSAKKGTLEIFTVQQGSKITTFTASKYSRLIYNTHSLMGFNMTSKSRFICQYTTLLIDNDGQIKEILVPFHFALNEKNNKRARDIHLYKKLRHFLKYKNDNENDDDEDENSETFHNNIYSIITELKTFEYQLQSLELLLTKKDLSPEILLKCIKYFIENFDMFLEDCGESESSKSLKILADNSLLILNFYLYCLNESKSEVENKEEDRLMNLDEREWDRLNNFVNLSIENKDLPSSNLVSNTYITSSKVEFNDNNAQLSAAEFLSIFNLKNNEININKNSDQHLLYKISEFIFKKFIECPNLNLDELYKNINSAKIISNDIFFILLYYWVNRPLNPNLELSKDMGNLLNLIMSLINLVNKNDLIADYNYESNFWKEIREILLNSSRPFPAFVAARLCKIAAKQIESDNNPDEDFEMLSQDMIQWDLLIGKLEDVSLLNIILSLNPGVKYSTLPKLRYEQIDISLQYVLEKGTGSVSELVSKWLALNGVDPENIVYNDIMEKEKFDESDSESEPEQELDMDALPKQELQAHKVAEVEEEKIFKFLNLMRQQFPYSLDASYLLANMCWEYGLAWKTNIQNLDNLEACTKCLKEIPNPHIKQGLYNLVWNTYFNLLFESTSKLINKVGRLPKEILCKQDTGLADYHLPIFLKICTNFLEDYISGSRRTDTIAKPEICFERIWENSSRALVDLAIHQNSINYDIIGLHYQLSSTLQMITNFSVKHSKPINRLFENFKLGLFFRDFQTITDINWNHTDSRVEESRIHFLTKVISASLESVVLVDGKLYTKEHMFWMMKIEQLAELWKLDIDSLRRYRLIQAYLNGFDILGDDVFNSVIDRKKLGPELLKIAANRLKQFLATSPNLGQNMACLTTTVSRYMQNLSKEDWCAPSTLPKIISLAQRVVSCYEENNLERKIAEQIIDGCTSIERLD